MSMSSLKKEVVKGKDFYGLDSISQNSVGTLVFLIKFHFLIALIAKMQTEQMSKKLKAKVCCPALLACPVSQALAPCTKHCCSFSVSFQNTFAEIETYVIYTKR